MRLVITIAAAATLAASPANAADTIIGPVKKLCREISSSEVQEASLGLMWVVGYVSGVNNLTKVDFLKGRNIEAIVDHFRDVCSESPDKTVLEAARSVVARLRIDLIKTR